jgi:hypothetical protein
LLVACSSKAKLVPQGGDCLQATDCADGLVCIPQPDGRRLCDNDLSGVQMIEDAAGPAVPDASRRDGSAEAGQDSGPTADADPGDTGTSDTSPE